jgi:hypothetical protein
MRGLIGPNNYSLSFIPESRLQYIFVNHLFSSSSHGLPINGLELFTYYASHRRVSNAN